jgi:branched-chain amino acid transport system ATP-binding protein
MLQGKKVTKNFGGLSAVKDVDFYVDKKEIVGLIGPNGAGKTTLFNLITGFYRPSSGVIEFNGEDITGRKPHEICKLGIARTLQIVRPFLKLTALENVVVGGVYGKNKSVGLSTARQEALKWLDFVGLRDKKDISARSLNLADRKWLEIARALATEPELILLDEVIAGLNPTETLKATDMIESIWKNLKIGVFWIEHVMRAIMTKCNRIIVLNYGEKIAEGRPKEIASNKKVIEAYLGEVYAHSE